ncbi:MAG: amidohydrolase [Bacteroidales bacterium]|nr:amidohydrolase [Bacteroidales bacterium]MCF8332761.1 amidohydrolase [Bacteroidales bacterium]
MQDLTVTLFQADLVWEDPDANKEKFSRKIANLKTSPDLIVLPEMFNTGFSVEPHKVAEPVNGPTVRWMHEQAESKNAVVTGSLIVKDGDDYFNRLIWMQPNGFYLTYDKRHLFRMGGEHKRFTGGKEPLLVTLKDWRIRPLICYDLRFPVWSKNVFNEDRYDYDLLIYVANWPHSRVHVWKTLLHARAIENQAYVAGVNRVGEDGNNLTYSGGTRVIDAKGDLWNIVADNEEGSVTQTLSHQKLADFRDKFKVGLDWDIFEIKK